MTAKQGRMIREVHYAMGLCPGAPLLIDGPRRCKLAAEMATLGWLEDCGAVGSFGRLGHAYKLTRVGLDAYNAMIDEGNAAPK